MRLRRKKTKVSARTADNGYSRTRGVRRGKSAPLSAYSGTKYRCFSRCNARLDVVSTTPADETPLVLTDTAAREWYMTRRGGGHLLDAHVSAITDRFGPGVSYSLRAPIDPLIGRPTLLIIEIDVPISDDASWEALDVVESDLLTQRQRLSELSRRKDPFANVAVTPMPLSLS